MKTYTAAEFSDGLRRVDVGAGDVTYVHSQLFTLGRLEGAKSQADLCECIVAAFFEVLTSEGTLVVPTFTTQTARYGVPFVLEETESITGALSEYVRRRPDSRRSLHPTDSVAAIGKCKEFVCENVSASNYGLDSPFDRMLKLNAKAVIVGMPNVSNSWWHYLEAVYNVPYRYNKLLDVPVYREGQLVNRPFLSTVRYLDYDIEEDLTYFDGVLRSRGAVREVKVGSGSISCIPTVEYCTIGLELLKENPYAFLKHSPKFRKGEIPWDGITDGRDELSKMGYYRFLAEDKGERGKTL